MRFRALYVLLFMLLEISHVPQLHANNDPYTVFYPINTPSRQEFNVNVDDSRSSQRAAQIRENNLDLQVSRLFELNAIVRLPHDAFQHFITSCSNSELLEQHHLYAHTRFLVYIRNLDEYETYVLQLHSKMRKNRSLEYIPGFDGKNGFKAFLQQEVDRINQRIQQHQLLLSKPRLNVHDRHVLKNLCAEYKQQSTSVSQSVDRQMILSARIKALEQTLQHKEHFFDYSYAVAWFDQHDQYTEIFSHHFGTALDCQLHKELILTRQTIATLQKQYSSNSNINLVAPFIHRLAASAKLESNPTTAFQLSDFCSAVTDFMVSGLSTLHDASKAFSKGVLKGIQKTLTPAHWQDMAISTLQLGFLFLDAAGQEDAQQDLIFASAFTKNFDAIKQAASDYCKQTAAQHDIFKHYIKSSYEKLKNMSWQELLEHGAELGTTMVLDTLTLHLLSGFSQSASKAVIECYYSSAEKGFLLNEQCAVDVAGFGKLIIQDGPQVTNIATEVIKHDTALFATNIQTDSAKNLCKIPLKVKTEHTIHKIRNIGENILDIMEKAGGHTLEKHVSKTNNELIRRATKEPLIDSASSFGSKRIAIKAVKENLRNNGKVIAQWLNDVNSGKKLVVELLHKYPIGNCVLGGTKNPIYNLTKSRIILIKDHTQELGFKVLTSFPVIS